MLLALSGCECQQREDRGWPENATINDTRLGERARHLLRVLVERYIKEGNPVGSRTLSRDSGLELSPATVRNVMADLEELGFILAPHTSAGRVPTDKGYRLFVDSLIKLRPLRERDVTHLQQQLDEHVDDGKALAVSASNMLSGFTHLAAVVTIPERRHAALRQIEFLPLSDRRVLAILVVNDQVVENRILHLERNYSREELIRAANYLNEHFAGRDVEAVRASLLEELERTHAQMNQMMVDAISMAQQVFETHDPEREEFVLAGEINLMEVAELSDVDKLRRLFEAFNQQRDILTLLSQSMHAEGVQIFIGHESGYQILDECSVVVAPYTVDDEVVGVLGVIGPTRMAYQRVIPIVDITAKLLGSALNSRN